MPELAEGIQKVKKTKKTLSVENLSTLGMQQQPQQQVAPQPSFIPYGATTGEQHLNASTSKFNSPPPANMMAESWCKDQQEQLRQQQDQLSQMLWMNSASNGGNHASATLMQMQMMQPQQPIMGCGNDVSDCSSSSRSTGHIMNSTVVGAAGQFAFGRSWHCVEEEEQDANNIFTNTAHHISLLDGVVGSSSNSEGYNGATELEPLPLPTGFGVAQTPLTTLHQLDLCLDTFAW